MKAKARRRVARMFAVRAAVLAALAAVGGLAGTVEAQQAVRQTDVQALNELAKRFAERFRVEHAAAVLWAQEQGIATLRIEQPDGRIVQLMYIRQGRPVYYTTHNANAADSVSTDEIQVGGSSGFDLDGTGVGLHIWDGGSVRTTHQELAGRVTLAEVVGLSNHATHVAGTMIATGVSAPAHGMANQATLTSYDFFNDETEMAAEGGVAILSNHSYGTITGWWFGDFGLGTGDDWHWFGDVTVSTAEDPNFGRYNQTASDWDQIAFNAPFWLIVKSAGNDRNDTGPSAGTLHWHWNGAWVQSSDTHPQDGGTTGYDSISTKGNAKNILTVGAVFDVIGGYSGPGSVSMSSFSGWGPTDDGRIKPDLVGNGIALTSSISTSDSAYASFSGTSMSAPNVCGSLALWVQHYRDTHGGSNMRAATVKGLAIHTADESGATPGPDYEFGWGLLNSLSAANLIDDDAANPEAIQELNLSQGQTISQIHAHNGVDPFKATICWTDLPGAAQPYVVDSTTSVLVNDLDLRVIGPGGGTVFPWILNPASPAGAATTGDNNLDNVEVVIIDAPTAGDYTVQITHKGTLSGGLQDFSLILSGFGSNRAPGPPLTAPFPHDRRKNRYISFDPDKTNNDGINVAFKVELKAITLGSSDGPAGNPPEVDFCQLGGSPPPSVCSGSGKACIVAAIDCNPGETCNPTGEICVNDVPNSGGSNVGTVWWVGPEQNGVHLLVSMPFRKESTNWANPVHAGDCEVVPEARYGVRAVNAGSGSESAELLVETTLFASISASWWGDCVGPLKTFCGGDIRTPECASNAQCTPPETCDRAWTLPDGSANFNDVNAALALVAPGPMSVAPDATWMDLHGNASNTLGSQNFDPPNFVLNFSDIGQILSGFGGFPYKGYDPADCPLLGACCDGATCTEELEASCVAGGRAYQGDGFTCTPNPCP